jgi:hypothetical protein
VNRQVDRVANGFDKSIFDMARAVAGEPSATGDTNALRIIAEAAKRKVIVTVSFPLVASYWRVLVYVTTPVLTRR